MINIGCHMKFQVGFDKATNMAALLRTEERPLQGTNKLRYSYI
jgi:hypothetical protein